VALVNCLNFGNPEHPEVMWQLSESIDGMAEACLALQTPVIGGNVSLYNASAGTDIDPTPVVAVLGVIDDLERRPPGMALVEGSSLVLLGDTDPSLAGSRWAVERHGQHDGTLPALDLAAHTRLVALVTRLVPVEGLLTSVHDVSGGGLALALAESALRSGVGCVVDGVGDFAGLFSESSSRVVLGTTRPDDVVAQATAAGVPACVIGSAHGDRIVVAGLLDIAVSDAVEAWRVALPGALGEPVTA
jgi:phosphoribosylformylglycinamidine synthase